MPASGGLAKNAAWVWLKGAERKGCNLLSPFSGSIRRVLLERVVLLEVQQLVADAGEGRISDDVPLFFMDWRT